MKKKHSFTQACTHAFSSPRVSTGPVLGGIAYSIGPLPTLTGCKSRPSTISVRYREHPVVNDGLRILLLHDRCLYQVYRSWVTGREFFQ